MRGHETIEEICSSVLNELVGVIVSKEESSAKTGMSVKSTINSLSTDSNVCEMATSSSACKTSVEPAAEDNAKRALPLTDQSDFLTIKLPRTALLRGLYEEKVDLRRRLGIITAALTSLSSQLQRLV